jgi:hypothetical protein
MTAYGLDAEKFFFTASVDNRAAELGHNLNPEWVEVGPRQLLNACQQCEMGVRILFRIDDVTVSGRALKERCTGGQR